MATPAWRPMRAGDLPDVDRIAAIVHPGYSEREVVPAERLRLFPAGCLIAPRGETVIGYAIAHPGIVGQPPALDSLLGALPDGADCLYIHDVALLSDARGQRLGAAVVGILAAIANHNGFACLALTAVNKSADFWSGQGFAAAPGGKSLASYGDDAIYMVCAL
jgi:GNAT superfamily N-acetyltransferase